MGLTRAVRPILAFRMGHADLFHADDVSDALRNLALDHANSNPFQGHYLGRDIAADLWGILRGQRPQQALIKQSCSIGHSMSKRRPADLTAEQAASVNTHPLIRQMSRALGGLRRGSKQYKEARRQLRKEKQRLKRELKQKIRHEWTAKQAVDDIERQLQGKGFAEDATVDASAPQPPAQKRLVEVLTAPVETTLEGQYRRRDKAIDAITAYCTVEEGLAVRQTKISSNELTLCPPTNDPPADDPRHIALMSTFVSSEKERPRRCFLCVGKALSLAPDDPYIGVLTREFYTPNDLTKHFKRKHLSNLRDGDEIQCRVCAMQLDHRMHLQNHALRIHGTVS